MSLILFFSKITPTKVEPLVILECSYSLSVLMTYGGDLSTAVRSFQIMISKLLSKDYFVPSYFKN